jgi:hypothetical protein
MQKLLTIYLDNLAYLGGKWLANTNADKHGLVEEHLTEYLSDGWKIASVVGIGGAADVAARGWIVVVLEK